MGMHPKKRHAKEKKKSVLKKLPSSLQTCLLHPWQGEIESSFARLAVVQNDKKAGNCVSEDHTGLPHRGDIHTGSAKKDLSKREVFYPPSTHPPELLGGREYTFSLPKSSSNFVEKRHASQSNTELPWEKGRVIFLGQMLTLHLGEKTSKTLLVTVRMP